MEIGSEFWKKEKKFVKDNEELFLAGRTALDTIIKDIMNEHKIVSALLPSYCCHTMIEPFLRNQIAVRFYDVFINEDGVLETKIPESRKNEIFYDIKYFGSDMILRDGISDSDIHKLWDVVVEDTTHSCFHGGHIFTADYEFASCRKWMAFDGIAIARKRQGVFRIKPQIWNWNESYCERRNQAFIMKSAYMMGKAIDKDDFLRIFGQAEEQLSKQYVDFRPNLNTVIDYYIEMQNLESMQNVRLKNAKLLVNGLKDIPDITILLDVDDPKICPLFVPIAVAPTVRNSLREYLIKQEIYCPVHWPVSDVHNGISHRAEKIYQHELSLICDQRYKEKDMQRILETVQDFFMRLKK